MNKANMIAIVTDGTRVLGLGDIGPEAGLPVMEGKALLFKYLGGVDAVPICLGTKDPDELIRTVKLLEPAFGAINLEDIAQPKCFRILETLRTEMTIPVWHDDQQGSATALLAGLLNALELVGKEPGRVRIAMVGMGAANVATYRLLTANGVAPQAIVACDRKGTLHKERRDIEERQEDLADKWRQSALLVFSSLPVDPAGCVWCKQGCLDIAARERRSSRARGRDSAEAEQDERTYRLIREGAHALGRLRSRDRH